MTTSWLKENDMRSEDCVIIYHANCIDGFCSYFIAEKFLKCPGHAWNYGQEPPPTELIKGKDVFILDFSFKRNQIIDMMMHARRVTILDHHDTAEKELKGLAEQVGVGLEIIFDQSKSGAKLTWDYFRQPEQTMISMYWSAVDDLVNYVQDRDLWKWQLPESREFGAFLRSFPMTVESWDQMLQDWDLRSYCTIGKAMNQQLHTQIQLNKQFATTVNIQDEIIPIVNCCNNISELVGELAASSPGKVAIGYFIDSTGMARCSARSVGGDPVGDGKAQRLAGWFGGGGHPNAAGFKLPAVELLMLVHPHK